MPPRRAVAAGPLVPEVEAVVVPAAVVPAVVVPVVAVVPVAVVPVVVVLAAVVPAAAAVQDDEHRLDAKESNMFADSVSFMWPPAAPQAVAYAQVGDFLQMWLHRERVDAEFDTCDACQTLNHRGALRCSTCGGRLMSNEDDAVEAARPKARGVARGMDVRALRRALTLVVLPPLLMFVGFGVWHEVRSGPRLTPHPAVIAQAPVHQVETPPLHLIAAEKREAVQPHVQSAATPIDQALEEELDATEALAARPPATWSPRSAPSRAKAIASAPARGESSLRTACSGGNFLARAVCVNNLCAARGASRQPQCHEAVRQRRIDEARRNPTLMG